MNFCSLNSHNLLDSRKMQLYVKGVLSALVSKIALVHKGWIDADGPYGMHRRKTRSGRTRSGGKQTKVEAGGKCMKWLHHKCFLTQNSVLPSHLAAFLRRMIRHLDVYPQRV